MSRPTMWPAVLPAQVREDQHRSAEVKVYDQLAKSLPPAWTVYYSRPWTGLTPTGRERDGECDFVLAHPKHGFLAIEVKGGEISFDPSTEGWQSRDRHGIRHKIKDPIEQARRSKHELLKKLKAQRGWRSDRFVRSRHGVIFPDTESPPRQLGADRPTEMFCCRPTMANIADWVSQRLKETSDEVGLDGDGMQALERLLATPFTLRVPLAHILDDDERAIASLTPQQFHILDAIADLRKVAIGGAAGTGKTIVAVEDAVRMSDTSARTLLTCNGSLLADNLRMRLSQTTVQVFTFQELCIDLARRAHLRTPKIIDSAFLDVGAPELLVQAVEQDPPLRFDAIVVDEGQDFRSHWWVALSSALAGPNSRLHVFYDTNQSLYGAVGSQLASFALVPIRLNRNLRNTQSIHQMANRHYTGPNTVSDGPAGVPTKEIISADGDIPMVVADVIRHLITTENVKPSDIAVLASKGERLNGISERLNPIAFLGITFETISRFKGLERQVVIVVADKDLSDEPELTYVALTRARAHLILVGKESILSWIRAPQILPRR
jgi:hypothetical protein